MVEQNCVYPDIDEIDRIATHVWLEEDGALVSYLRFFERKEEPGTIQIGRVLSLKRRAHLGTALMEYALSKIPESSLYLEAQVYAIPFYEQFGFQVTSEQFLEDGIPHVKMRLQR